MHPIIVWALGSILFIIFNDGSDHTRYLVALGYWAIVGAVLIMIGG